MKPTLLILSVLRSADTRAFLNEVFESAGHKFVHASSFEQALILLGNGIAADLVLVEPPVEAESSALASIRQAASGSPVCVIHEAGEQQFTNDVVESGAMLFLERPISRDDVYGILEQLCTTEIKRAERGLEQPVELKSAGKDTLAAGQVLEELADGRYFFAASNSMLKIYRQVQLLADVDAPVLILGESGTGKEIIAHLIHKYSRRSQYRFVNVNCAALPSDLLESEFFGYQQGAFTGAIKDKPGKFEQANRGTLLLDEIGEMSAQMQAKLLHVLQDGQFSRLGARESSKVDVRVLAATNVDIERALVGKTFREDLFYRLNVFTIQVPPLRERREEIPFLIEETIRRSPEMARNGHDFVFSSRLMDAALLYDWRGNLRELRNFVTRSVTMRDPDMAIRELETKIGAGIQMERERPVVSPLPQENAGMRSVMRDMKDRVEAQMIREALEASGWNRRHAAKYLEISYRGLLYKIQQHQLTREAPAWSRPISKI